MSHWATSQARRNWFRALGAMYMYKDPVMKGIKCVLLDIGKYELLEATSQGLGIDHSLEGTICPISFVKETLVGNLHFDPQSRTKEPSLRSSE